MYPSKIIIYFFEIEPYVYRFSFSIVSQVHIYRKANLVYDIIIVIIGYSIASYTTMLHASQ